MPTLLFISHDGVQQSVEAKIGESIMEAAVKNSVIGIDADCGGACACATCHVYIDKAFDKFLTAADDMEQSMLEFADDVQDNSRLSCQIKVTDQMDGIKVRTPEAQ